jgi:putative ATPase
MELFEAASQARFEPLAYRMRPRTLDEFVGQEHIVGPGRLLRRAIQADQLSSLIFYGPPGSGKTTLAKVIANTTRSNFVTINAVLCGVKELREVVAEAKNERTLYDKRTILFVDEVHRWNKAQQDALLPWVENGTVIFIGATTQNPFFEVNSALVSRSRIFQLITLKNEDLDKIARQTLQDKERGYGKLKVKIDEEALNHLVHVADGDARSLLNALELAVETTPKVFPPPPEELIHITLEIAEESIQKKVVLYDKQGDYHFDTISAFIKSLRGSDPDAAFYWLAKMVHAGEDPKFIFRRMLILAAEDVGMADPQALVVIEAAARAFERIGLPEGRYHLALAALYLATAPKSNSCMGFFDALSCVENEEQNEVPTHLKDASRDKKGFGHGEGYLYPHAYRDHWIAQQYLPRALQGRIFYKPGKIGYEARIGDEVAKRREAQLEAMFAEAPPEVLTFSPPSGQKEVWLKRAIDNADSNLAAIRDLLFSHLPIKRHYCILDLKAAGGLFLWEAVRKVPEGCVYALTPKKEEQDLLTHFGQAFALVERPVLVLGSIVELDMAKRKEFFHDISFDVIMGRNVLARVKNKLETLHKIALLAKDQGYLALAELVPVRSSRLTEMVNLKRLDKSLARALLETESIIYSASDNPLVNWNEKDLVSFCEQAGFKIIFKEQKTITEKRVVNEETLKRWFAEGGENQGYGCILKGLVKAEEFAVLTDVIKQELLSKVLDWRTEVALIAAQKV